MIRRTQRNPAYCPSPLPEAAASPMPIPLCHLEAIIVQSMFGHLPGQIFSRHLLAVQAFNLAAAAPSLRAAMTAGAVQCICILRPGCEVGFQVIGIPCRLPLVFRPQATIKVQRVRVVGRPVLQTSRFPFLSGKQCLAIFWLRCRLPPAV
jgi:hypothetical protein